MHSKVTASVRKVGSTAGTAACNRGNDADRVSVLRRRIFFGQIANIFIVHVHVHEAAQLPLFREQMLSQIPEFRGQMPQSLAHRRRLHFREVALPRINTQRRRNNHFHGHHFSPHLNAGSSAGILSLSCRNSMSSLAPLSQSPRTHIRHGHRSSATRSSPPVFHWPRLQSHSYTTARHVPGHIDSDSPDDPGANDTSPPVPTPVPAQLCPRCARPPGLQKSDSAASPLAGSPAGTRPQSRVSAVALHQPWPHLPRERHHVPAALRSIHGA